MWFSNFNRGFYSLDILHHSKHCLCCNSKMNILICHVVIIKSKFWKGCAHIHKGRVNSCHHRQWGCKINLLNYFIFLLYSEFRISFSIEKEICMRFPVWVSSMNSLFSWTMISKNNHHCVVFYWFRDKSE